MKQYLRPIGRHFSADRAVSILCMALALSACGGGDNTPGSQSNAVAPSGAMMHAAAVTTTQDTLVAGSSLSTGQSLVSSNGRAKLILQGDGNLVLYTAAGKPWSPSPRPMK